MPAEQLQASPDLREKFAAAFGKPDLYGIPDPQGNQVATQPEPTPATNEPPAVEGADDSDEFKADPSDSPDVAKLKEDLRKGFHRKMQKVSEKEREMEARFGQKAQAFDMLMNHPDPAALLQQLRPGSPQGGAPTEPQAPSMKYKFDKSIEEAFEPETLGPLQGLIDSMVEQRMKAFEDTLTPHKRMVEQYAQTQYEGVWGTLKAEYPTADKYRKETERIASTMGIPLKQALLLASEGAVVSDKMKTASETVRAAELTPRGAPAAMTRNSNGKLAFDKNAAARKVAEDAKRLGLNLFNSY